MTRLSISDILELDALLPPDVPVFHCPCCEGFAGRFEHLLRFAQDLTPAVRSPFVPGLALAVAYAWSINRHIDWEDVWPRLCPSASGRHLASMVYAFDGLADHLAGVDPEQQLRRRLDELQLQLFRPAGENDDVQPSA